MNFLGEGFEPQQIDSTKYSKNVTVNTKKEHFSNLSKPISKSSQGRWLSEMSSDEVNTFNKIAGNELRLLGYLTD